MRADNASERGLSLIEVLVATAILSLAVVVALTVYDASRKAFAKGENATEQQESVRIAFDLMSSDIRMLGFNVNPDGNPNRPDEQLEGALDHAMILRGDFDHADPAASLAPEATLAGGAFPTVSTGNDEIVAYVLSKPDGTGPDTITFEADVQEPARDGRVEPVTIGNVVLDPTSPPYTLYRVTLNNNGATYGTPAFVVRTPVAENVRNLSFIYYSATGTFQDASATIPETAAAKAARSGLTRVNVSLIGMTRQEDLNYVDTSDTAAPRHRKFELGGDVTPRNMRYKGIPDLGTDLTPPTKPVTPTLTPGHCGGLIVTWAANPLADGVTQYKMLWGPSSGVVAGTRNVPGSPFFLDALTEGATYFVSIQAQDAEGNMSARSDPASAPVVNQNTPSAPTVFTTSKDQTYRVNVSWAPVTTNSAKVPSADPLAPRIRELAGYRLYWGPPSDPKPTTLVVGESVLDTSFQPPYADAPLVACLDRNYVLTAVDGCGLESAPTPISVGRVADSGVKPKAPANVQAHFVGVNSAQVKWKPITQDVDGKAIKIDRYEIFRSSPIDGTAPPASAVWDPAPLAVVPTLYYQDGSVPPLLAGQVVYYRVTGADPCGNVSDPSSEGKLECAFTGDVEFVTPKDGQLVSGLVPTTVRVTNGTDTYVSVEITYVLGAKGKSRTFTSATPGTSWTDNGWKASPQGVFTITATVTNATGCVDTETIDVIATNPPATTP
jgi:prepilin-type N-terminal cleavage/methylation domain-containing protein